MKQLYYDLAEGEPKSEALRLAKLRFLKSNTALAKPRYWAAFVLNGDGWNPSRRAIPWSAVAGAVAVLLALAGLALSTQRELRRDRRKDRFRNQRLDNLKHCRLVPGRSRRRPESQT